MKSHLLIIKSINPFNYLKMTHYLKHFLILPIIFKFISINLKSINLFNQLFHSIIKSNFIITNSNLIIIESNLKIIIFIFLFLNL